jgi:hypothetical protein
MGLGRAVDGALGFSAVIRASRPAALLLAAGSLAGCSTIGAVAGAAAGASTGVATANPVVGYATAVAVNAGIDELQKYVARVRDGAEQDAIVAAVGEMQPGQLRAWKIVHDIPLFDDEHGEMQIVRDISTPLTQCKEVVFTVESGAPPHPARALYTTDACRNTGGWKWASAEPAVERWGYFQHIGP